MKLKGIYVDFPPEKLDVFGWTPSSVMTSQGATFHAEDNPTLFDKLNNDHVLLFSFTMLTILHLVKVVITPVFFVYAAIPR